MSDCIFCKILQGDVPVAKVYEDEHAYAFLDINPSTAGHTLVIPKKHYERYTDIPENELGSFMISLQKVCKGIEKYAGAFNILQNNGKVSGQLVMHVHFHVIPRREGDSVIIGHWDKANVDMDKVQKELQSLLN